eukprot:TRINITY_DN1298_c1_g1_i1.p1 TRINITY_DN1298_c1_g1~~TRINITY_DN1298_c1_g1_i1.p1  ORF type:complete len:321 (+),score=68.28 TRINITY_DN1298_c1_g1_i1:114-1076(+)
MSKPGGKTYEYVLEELDARLAELKKSQKGPVEKRLSVLDLQKVAWKVVRTLKNYVRPETTTDRKAFWQEVEVYLEKLVNHKEFNVGVFMEEGLWPELKYKDLIDTFSKLTKLTKERQAKGAAFTLSALESIRLYDDDDSNQDKGKDKGKFKGKGKDKGKGKEKNRDNGKGNSSEQKGQKMREGKGSDKDDSWGKGKGAGWNSWSGWGSGSWSSYWGGVSRDDSWWSAASPSPSEGEEDSEREAKKRKVSAPEDEESKKYDPAELQNDPPAGDVVRWTQLQDTLFSHLPPLPENWLRLRSKTHRCIYYYNKATGESKYEKP